jgi:hypothetical protein
MIAKKAAIKALVPPKEKAHLNPAVFQMNPIMGLAGELLFLKCLEDLFFFRGI